MRNDVLEQLVIQRTSQLEAANKDLSNEMEIRKKAEEKLLKKQDIFLKIFSAVPMGLLLLDSETVIVDANQAIYSMVLREPTEIIGRRQGDALGCIHSFETPKGCRFSDSCPACPLRNGIEQIIAENHRIHGLELNLTLMINGKPGDRCLSVSAEPVDIDGHLHVIVAIDDMTERKKTEEALKESKHQLEELNATKDKLFSIIGHDLRGPIGGFKQLIELTLSNYDLSDTKSLTEILQLIQESASTIYDLLENLLSWAKSQRNEVVFMPTKVNLHEIIDACTSLLSEIASSKNISIHNQSSPNQFVFADQNMLMTILRNLLTNAIKFTHPNKNIYLSVIDTGVDISISVKDEGVGINYETLSNLFKSTDYLTTIGTSGEKGTGLGLLLCKEFVVKQGGKIWVESEVGHGSNFSFTLPL